jgi:Lipopolysaccharide-assembly
MLLMASGCGYRFGASGTNLPATAKTIYVRPFGNNTAITGLNDIFMRYLKDEIAQHKRLELVQNARDADLVLSGSLITTIVDPTAFNPVNEPTIYNKALVVRAALRDTRTNKVIWSTAGLSDTESFPVVAQSVVTTTPAFLEQNLRSKDIAAMTDIQVAQTQDDASRNLMMTNLVKLLYDSMASGF